MPTTTLGSPRTPDVRGDDIIQQLSKLIILDSPGTLNLKPYNIATNPTSPDLSLATPYIAFRGNWAAIQALPSDHIPFIVLPLLSPPT